MDRIMEKALLYDFYGEFLTEHQRLIYEDYVFNDLSLGEIAENTGISRQGVHDLVKRCDRQLNEYEEKLHLVDKFAQTKEQIARLQQLFREYRQTADETTGGQIETLLEEMSG